MMADKASTLKLPSGAFPSPGLTNPVLENIYRRRSVRSYRPDQVPDDILLELIKAGTYAPTARGQQLWRFAVVTDRAEIDRLSERAKSLWRRHPLFLIGSTGMLGPGPKRLTKLMNSELHLFHHAPAVVFIFAPKTDFIVDDCAAATENMLLAARSLGLGSCWIGFARPLDKDRKTRAELKVPSKHRLMAAMVFGYPSNDFAKAPKREENVLISWIAQ